MCLVYVVIDCGALVVGGSGGWMAVSHRFSRYSVQRAREYEKQEHESNYKVYANMAHLYSIYQTMFKQISISYLYILKLNTYTHTHTPIQIKCPCMCVLFIYPYCQCIAFSLRHEAETPRLYELDMYDGKG